MGGEKVPGRDPRQGALGRRLHLSGPQFPHPFLAVPEAAPSDCWWKEKWPQKDVSSQKAGQGGGRASGPRWAAYCLCGLVQIA